MSGAEGAQDKDKGEDDPEVVFVDSRNVQCPVAGWEVFLRKRFKEITRGGNAHWMFADDIKLLKRKVIARDALAEGKAKALRENGKRFHTKKLWPEYLIELEKEADRLKAKSTNDVWYLKEFQGKEELFHKKKKKPDTLCLPVEDSYRILNEIHISQGHNSSRDLFNYLNNHGIAGYPREIVLDFIKYCPECRLSNQNNIRRRKEKISGRNYQFFLNDLASMVTPENVLCVRAIPIPDAVDVPFLRYIMFGFFTSSEFCMIETATELSRDSLAIKIASFLVRSKGPFAIHFDLPIEESIHEEVRIV